MGKTKRISIPPQLQLDYFFEDEHIDLAIEKVKNTDALIHHELFPYELAFYANIECYHPWEDANHSVLQLIHEWKQLHVRLADLFEKRDRLNVHKPMKQGIALFIQCLFWLNDIPVAFVEQRINDEQLKWKPINIKERLAFILQQPTFYHSFVQLNELMAELEKRYYIKKASRK